MCNNAMLGNSMEFPVDGQTTPPHASTIAQLPAQDASGSVHGLFVEQDDKARFNPRLLL